MSLVLLLLHHKRTIPESTWKRTKTHLVKWSRPTCSVHTWVHFKLTKKVKKGWKYAVWVCWFKRNDDMKDSAFYLISECGDVGLCCFVINCTGFIWLFTRIEIKARETPVWQINQRYKSKAIMHSPSCSAWILKNSLEEDGEGGVWEADEKQQLQEKCCCGGRAQHLALSHWFQLSNKLDHFSHRPAAAPLAFYLFSHLAELPALRVQSGKTPTWHICSHKAHMQLIVTAVWDLQND